jgi:large subunit ribosomal protein L32
MAAPKRKSSKSKVRRRRNQIKREQLDARPCPQCGAPGQSHRVCASCGTYQGRQVLTIDADD